MKSRHLLRVAAALLAATVPVAVWAVPSSTASSHLKTVVTFDRSLGQLPQGVAFDASGSMYVSFALNGQVLQIAPDGAQTVLATLPTGEGYLTGLAVDQVGRVYVGVATFLKEPAPGVFRIERTATGVEMTRMLSLPKGAVPQGLAFRFGELYVSDSAHGAIYRVHGNGTSELWIRDSLLAPDHAVGVTGLAWYSGSLYAAVSDSGRIVSIPIGPAGEAGAPAVVAQRMRLTGAAGLAFTDEGTLYITTSFKHRFLELAPDGQLTQLASARGGLAFPTGVAYSTEKGMRHVMFFANAAMDQGVPCIMKLRVEDRGRHVP